jgi:hypothetical protein
MAFGRLLDQFQGGLKVIPGPWGWSRTIFDPSWWPQATQKVAPALATSRSGLQATSNLHFHFFLKIKIKIKNKFFKFII